MKVHIIDAGNFKLDGGAMFGVVPKTFWNKLNPADENNLCSWKMRCLLVEDGEQLILIDCGMGNKQNLKWQGYYYRHGEGDLIQSLAQKGFKKEDITDVILTHLHFDHCGGAVEWNADQTGYQTTFPNAKYWSHSAHYEWAVNANPREKATFFSENISPIKEQNQLYFIDQQPKNPFNNIHCLFADGHTEKMIMPMIQLDGQQILFITDTLPSTAHIPVSYVMSYDMRPLQTMQEKEILLQKALVENWILVFCHDPIYEACTITKNEKSYIAKHKGDLNEVLQITINQHIEQI
ncbi:MAG: MBL fold metallo-hydrolase [Pseudarcicella sp.]|nr:MBL fold metallo-hydrolase [Pseudarcicella sp.]MBP6410883.1 MBL fold metallo-hydrolase [Pseudarcicella sp.]